MSNKYFFNGKISDAEFTGLNRGTVNNIFNKLCERIVSICEAIHSLILLKNLSTVTRFIPNKC